MIITPLLLLNYICLCLGSPFTIWDKAAPTSESSPSQFLTNATLALKSINLASVAGTLDRSLMTNHYVRPTATQSSHQYPMDFNKCHQGLVGAEDAVWWRQVLMSNFQFEGTSFNCQTLNNDKNGGLGTSSLLLKIQELPWHQILASPFWVDPQEPSPETKEKAAIQRERWISVGKTVTKLFARAGALKNAASDYVKMEE